MTPEGLEQIPGKWLVEQIGKPLELYDRPNNLFVASFIGSPAMNLLKGRLGAGGFEAEGGVSMPLAATVNGQPGAEVVLGIRPEHLRLSDSGFPVTVAVVEPTGSEVQVIGRTAGGAEIVANFRDRHEFAPGDTIRLSAEPHLIHLFKGDSGTRL